MTSPVRLLQPSVSTAYEVKSYRLRTGEVIVDPAGGKVVVDDVGDADEVVETQDENTPKLP